MSILSNLRTLARGSIRRASRSGRKAIRKPSLCRPCVEALEDRRVLSGIQMIALDDGTFQLRVDGDAKANQVSIVGHAPSDQTNDYSLVVMCDKLKQTVTHVSEVVIDTAGGADTVLLTGQWAFQGKGQTMSGVRSVSISTGGDDDAVKFNDFNGQSVNGIPGPHIVIDTGNGDDLAWFRPIFHPPTLFAGLELSVRTGGGDDSVLVENLAFAADAATSSILAIDTAGGDDVVTLANSSAGADIIGPEVEFSGAEVNVSVATVATVIDTGNGDDKVSVTGSWGSVSDILIGLGGGSDILSIAHAQFVRSLDLGVSTDNGFAYTHIEAQRQIIESAFSTGTFRENDRLRNAGPDGNDIATIIGSTFNGGLHLSATGGAGDDEMFLEYNKVSGAASVTLELDRGDDHAILEENYFLDVFHLQIGGGAGKDVIICEDDWLSGLTDYKISLGDGEDTATFEGNAYDQGLNMVLDAGAGRDTVKFHRNSFATTPSDSELAGALNAYIDLGDGDDTATFAENVVNGVWKTIFNGGDGNDVVTILCDGLGPVTVFVDLGDGRDTANVNLTHFNQDPAQHKPIAIDVLGGKGDDLVTILCDGFGPVSVLVNLGDGRDTANVNLTYFNQDPAQHKPIAIDVLGGKGDDLVTILCNGAGPVSVLVDLGDGNDSALISIICPEVSDISGDDSKSVNVSGGAGRDNLFLSFLGQVTGNLDVKLDGGDDNDNIDAVFNLLGQSTGSLFAEVLGGKGNDNLGLHVFDSYSLKLFASIDGGEGVDKAKTTPNVTVNNCEK